MSKHNNFYIYSKQGCGFCDRLVEYLDSKEIPYVKFNLGSDFSAGEFVDKFGNNATFPQVFHENNNIGGMKDTLRYLVENNYV